jgi:Rod binding domain-containing protein
MNFAIAAPAASVSATTPPSPEAAQHHKLIETAQQFEGMLLQELLKPMKEHGFCQDDDQGASDDKDGASGFGDTLTSFGSEAMATAIAKAGGLGIANRVVAQVESEKASHSRTAAGPNPEGIPK